MPSFGCGVNSNIAMMVANPEDLIHGREGAATGDVDAADFSACPNDDRFIVRHPIEAGIYALDGPSLLHVAVEAVEELAPEALTVPSGNTRRLEYAIGKPPVLAVKLQELFGLADTPRIAQGKVPVTLHLLSPAQRPIQVTQDLRGFFG